MSSDYVLETGTLWRLLQRLDVLRRPERVEAFVQACECDKRQIRTRSDRSHYSRFTH